MLGLLLSAIASLGERTQPYQSASRGPETLGLPYEYPNKTEHAVVVGPFPYAHGPTIWNDTMASDTPFGGWGLSEGWTFNIARPSTYTARLHATSGRRTRLRA